MTYEFNRKKYNDDDGGIYSTQIATVDFKIKFVSLLKDGRFAEEYQLQNRVRCISQRKNSNTNQFKFISYWYCKSDLGYVALNNCTTYTIAPF